MNKKIIISILILACTLFITGCSLTSNKTRTDNPLNSNNSPLTDSEAVLGDNTVSKENVIPPKGPSEN